MADSSDPIAWQSAPLPLDEKAPMEPWLACERVALEDGWLSKTADFSYFSSVRLHAQLPAGLKWVSQGQGMLRGFLDLYDATDDRIAEYASRWGLLGLCRHGYGPHHPPELDEVYDPATTTPGNFVRPCPPLAAEPTAEWRRTSLVMREMYVDLAAIERGLRPTFRWQPPLWDEEGWDDEDFRREWDEEHRARGTDEQARQVCRESLAEWITDIFLVGAGITVSLAWEAKAPRLTIVPGSLFGALGYQLATWFSMSKGLAICASCGSWYSPSRRPAAGRRTYCPEPECQRQSKRDSARDHARRKAAEKGKNNG